MLISEQILFFFPVVKHTDLGSSLIITVFLPNEEVFKKRFKINNRLIFGFQYSIPIIVINFSTSNTTY